MRTLLKDGFIIDGTGSAKRKADLLIRNDIIEAVGNISPATADKIIEVKDKCVSPGFIDAHSHNDWFAARKEKEKYFAPFAEQGITTQITGNCGFSPFGFEKGTVYEGLLGSGLFSRGDAEGDFSRLRGFAEACGKTVLNIVPLYGHMSGRISIQGYENTGLGPEGHKRLDSQIEQAFDDGAWGLSFGLMYEPDRYAPYSELKRAAEITARRGGVVTVHGRALSSASTSYSPPVGGRPHNLRALDEMVRLAEETGVKLQYSHLIFVGSKTWKTAEEALSIIHNARSRGIDFQYDSYAMTCGASVITVIMPPWFLSLPPEKRHSPGVRFRIALEVGVTKKLLGFDFDDIVIAWLGEGYKELCGRNVHSIAEEWKLSDLDAYLKLVELSGGKGRVIMHKYLTDKILSALMKDPLCLCMTDAWVEEKGMQNGASYGCFPEFLRIASAENNLEHTVRQMTGATADRFGIKNRGYLKEGYVADITVFDPKAVSPSRQPDGRPDGIETVFISGRPIVSGGVFNGESFGSILFRNC